MVFHVVQFNFKEGKDFNLLNVEQVRKKQNGASCGTVIKKMYTLTPETFKICLMRSQNTLDYNMYFTFIEKVMKYYSDYQAELDTLFFLNKVSIYFCLLLFEIHKIDFDIFKTYTIADCTKNFAFIY